MFVKIVRKTGEKLVQCESYDLSIFPAKENQPAYSVIELHPNKGTFSIAANEGSTIYIMNDQGHTIDRHWCRGERK